MSETIQARLLKNEPFVIHNKLGVYEWQKVYRVFKPANGLLSYELQIDVLENISKIKLIQFKLGHTITNIGEDHLYVCINGILSSYIECIPYSRIVFVSDLAANQPQKVTA